MPESSKENQNVVPEQSVQRKLLEVLLHNATERAKENPLTALATCLAIGSVVPVFVRQVWQLPIMGLISLGCALWLLLSSRTRGKFVVDWLTLVVMMLLVTFCAGAAVYMKSDPSNSLLSVAAGMVFIGYYAWDLRRSRRRANEILDEIAVAPDEWGMGVLPLLRKLRPWAARLRKMGHPEIAMFESERTLIVAFLSTARLAQDTAECLVNTTAMLKSVTKPAGAPLQAEALLAALADAGEHAMQASSQQ